MAQCLENLQQAERLRQRQRGPAVGGEWGVACLTPLWKNPQFSVTHELWGKLGGQGWEQFKVLSPRSLRSNSVCSTRLASLLTQLVSIFKAARLS